MDLTEDEEATPIMLVTKEMQDAYADARGMKRKTSDDCKKTIKIKLASSASESEVSKDILDISQTLSDMYENMAETSVDSAIVLPVSERVHNETFDIILEYLSAFSKKKSEYFPPTNNDDTAQAEKKICCTYDNPSSEEDDVNMDTPVARPEEFKDLLKVFNNINRKEILEWEYAIVEKLTKEQVLCLMIEADFLAIICITSLCAAEINRRMIAKYQLK